MTGFLGLEDLRARREDVTKQIQKEEEIKAKIQNDLRVLTERLARANDSLARKIASRTEYERTIQETEMAYKKVLFVEFITIDILLAIVADFG